MAVNAIHSCSCLHYTFLSACTVFSITTVFEFYAFNSCEGIKVWCVYFIVSFITGFGAQCTYSGKFIYPEPSCFACNIFIQCLHLLHIISQNNFTKTDDCAGAITAPQPISLTEPLLTI